MGYNEQGHCPMFVGNKCSIYEDRPLACRQYDCRIFAATGVAVDAVSQPDIAERVKGWEFTDDAEREALRALAAELGKNFRGTSTQLAVLAVTTYQVRGGRRPEPR